MKVYVIGDDLVEEMFKQRGWKITTQPYGSDLVQFTGGSDVFPPFYGEQMKPETCSCPERDYEEQKIFHLTLELGIPMAGICRGGQFLNVMNRGKLIQHVEGHALYEGHKACDLGSGRHLMVSSTHHQGIIPSEGCCPLLFPVHNFVSKSEQEDWYKPLEAGFYKETKSLMFQPHPEFNNAANMSCRELYFHYIDTYLFPSRKA